MSARIIEFEGLDCSFKETNARRLKDTLTGMGYKVHLYSFPNYGSDSSLEVREFLSGQHRLCKYKDDPEFAGEICSLYANDRKQTWDSEIKEVYENGDDSTIIILDRWVYSNFYALANFIPVEQANTKMAKLAIDNFVRWLEEYEFITNGLPRADHVIYMHAPIAKVLQTIHKKEGKDDIESNATLLCRTHKVFEYIFNESVECSTINTTYIPVGKVTPEFRDEDSIASDVLSAVETALGL